MNKILFVGLGSVNVGGYGKTVSLLGSLLSYLGVEVHCLNSRTKDPVEYGGILNLPARDDPWYSDSLPIYNECYHYDRIITVVDTYCLSWICDFEGLLSKTLCYAPLDFTLDEASLEVNPLLMRAPEIAVPSEWAYLMLTAVRDSVHRIPHPLSPAFKPTKGAKQTSRSDHGIPKDAFVIGCFQGNQAIHNLPTVLEAYAKFRKYHPNCLLYMHCDPAPFTEMLPDKTRRVNQVEKKRYEGRSYDLGRMMRKLGLPDESVAFPPPDWLMNPVSDEIMAYLYSACDCTISLSYAEGFSYPLYESLACGVPIVAPLNTAQKEIVQKYGRFVTQEKSHFYPINRGELDSCNPINIQSAIDALEETYVSDNTKMIRKGLKYVQQFRVDRVVMKYWVPLLKGLGIQFTNELKIAPTERVKIEVGKRSEPNVETITLAEMRADE